MSIALTKQVVNMLVNGFPCIYCSTPTTGSRDKDGVLWAMCDKCMQEQGGEPSALGKER